jgi:hypothetical protein
MRTRQIVLLASIVVTVLAVLGGGLYALGKIRAHETDSLAGAGVVPSPPQSPVPDPSAPASCADVRSWSADQQTGEGPATAGVALYKVDAWFHDAGCYDRATFWLRSATTVTYDAHYLEPGTHLDAMVAGGAVLQLRINAPLQTVPDASPWKITPEFRTTLVSSDFTRGYNALRQVRVAEAATGHATFNIGVKEKLPFRLGYQSDTGSLFLFIDFGHTV